MRRKDYLRLMKLLRKEAYSLGVTVKLYRRPIHYPNRFGVTGGYNGLTKKICITAYGNQSYGYILGVLAHEIRHAQHDSLGLYANYYQKELYDVDKFAEQVLNNKKKLPSLSIAVRAENDCNLFAINFMKQQGFPLKKKTYNLFFESYPARETLAYEIKRSYLRLKNKQRSLL